jgi:hypothetical protein
VTNARVATVAAATDDQTLTPKYTDGTQTVKVKPRVPMVAFAPGDKADAKVGAKVFLGATRGSDGNHPPAGRKGRADTADGGGARVARV